MAYLAVNKNGIELISEYTMFRNGERKRYMKCANPDKCERCFSKTFCKTDVDGRKYRMEVYSVVPPKIEDKAEAIEKLSFWDNFEIDPDGNHLDFTVELPKGSIKKLIGRELTWEDEPFEYCQ